MATLNGTRGDDRPAASTDLRKLLGARERRNDLARNLVDGVYGHLCTVRELAIGILSDTTDAELAAAMAEAAIYMTALGKFKLSVATSILMGQNLPVAASWDDVIECLDLDTEVVELARTGGSL